MLGWVQGARGADPNMLYQSNTINPENQNQMQNIEAMASDPSGHLDFEHLSFLVAVSCCCFLGLGWLAWLGSLVGWLGEAWCGYYSGVRCALPCISEMVCFPEGCLNSLNCSSDDSLRLHAWAN